MDTQLTVWIFWLLHLLITLQKARCAFVLKTYMSWSDGFNRCQLANEKDVENHIEYYRAWVGALAVHTPWMVHEGCFYFNKTKDIKRQLFNDNSPARCSYFCRSYRYFSVVGRFCRCADHTRNVSKTYSYWCSDPCPGSIEERCGSTKFDYVNFFSHITEKYIPTKSSEKETCSVLVVANNTCHLEAEECWKNHMSLCENNENSTYIYMSTKETYNEANKSCKLSSNFDSDVISKLQLHDGKYWTGIYRVQIIRWLEQETLQDLCNEFGSLDKLKCILVQYKSKLNILKTPVSCTEWHPILCSRSKEISTNSSMTVCKRDIPVNTDGNSSPTTTLETIQSTGSMNLKQETTIFTSLPPDKPISTDRKPYTTSTLVTTEPTEKYTENMDGKLETTTKRAIQTTNEMSTTDVSLPTHGVADGPYSFYWLIVTGGITIFVFCTITIVVGSLVCFFRNKRHQVFSLHSKVNSKQQSSDQQTYKSADIIENQVICNSEEKFLNDKSHTCHENDYHHLRFDRRQENVPNFAEGHEYDFTNAESLFRNDKHINPLNVTKFAGVQEYDSANTGSLFRNDNHMHVTRFAGGHEYDYAYTEDMIRTENHLNPAQSNNMLRNQVFDYEVGKSANFTFRPTDNALYCQTDIKHSKYTYDSPRPLELDNE